jgi:hypothetical protein
MSPPQDLLFRTRTEATSSQSVRLTGGCLSMPHERHLVIGGTSMPLAALATVHDPSVREAVLRLADEFPDLRPRSIVLVANTCREELRGSPDGALPELVERLARHRLRVSLPEAEGEGASGRC